MKHTVMMACLFVSMAAHAADKVILKNGDIYRGEVIEQRMNQYIQIRLPDNSERRLLWNDIDSVAKEETHKEPHKESAPIVGFGAALTGLATGLEGENNGGPYFAYGANVGFNLTDRPDNKLALGLLVLRFSDSESAGGVEAEASITNLGLEFLDRNIVGGLYAGGMVGIGIRTISVSNIYAVSMVTESGTAFAAGPVIGYEIPLSPQFSIGPEVSYITTFSGKVAGYKLKTVGYLSPVFSARLNF